MKKYLTVLITLILVPLSAILVLKVAQFIEVDLRELQGTGFKVKPKTLFIAYLFVGLQILLVWLGHSIILKKKFLSLGFKKKKWLMLFLKGCLIGVGIKTVIYAIYLGSAADFSFDFAVPTETTFMDLAGTYLYYFIFLLTLNSFTEELVYRAFPLENLLDGKYSETLIVLIVALLFSLVHHLLEPFTWTAFFTRFLFGTLAGLLYLQHRNIWLPIGLHNGWNWVSTSFSGNWTAGGIFDLTTSDPVFDRSMLSIALLVPLIIYYYYSNSKDQIKRTSTKAIMDNCS